MGEGEGRGLSPFLLLSLYSIVYQSVRIQILGTVARVISMSNTVCNIVVWEFVIVPQTELES